MSWYRSAAVVVSLTVLASACGSAAGSPDGAVGSPTVVATTGIWADVVDNVTCGTATVDALIPDGADPHAFEPSLADRGSLDQASLVVVNGFGLEGTLEDTLGSIDESAVFVAADRVESLQGDDGIDPHVWLDPRRVAGVIPSLAEALVAAGLDRAAVERCAAAYADELLALDAEIAALVAELPADRRKLVTSHDALGYFADRYGFEVVGTVIPSVSSLGAANPAALEALIETIRREGVSAVFADSQAILDDTDAVADRAGVDVVALDITSLDDASPSYVELMRTTTRRIVTALR